MKQIVNKGQKEEDFLFSYLVNPEKGRRAMRLLARISNVDNEELVNRMLNNQEGRETMTKDAYNGIASSLLHYRQRLPANHKNHYTGDVIFNGNYAGCYITVTEDHFGYNTVYTSNDMFHGALFTANNVFENATLNDIIDDVEVKTKGLPLRFEGGQILATKNHTLVPEMFGD